MNRFPLVAAAALLVVAGCAMPTLPTDADTGLEALRLEYGLQDCPATAPAGQEVEGDLPDVDLTCLGTSDQVNLAGWPEGPKVINFWAQWCAPCRVEAPFLREAHAARPDVQFIGVNYDDPDQERAIEFAGLAELDWPHVRDRHKQLQGLGVPGLPVTLLVSPGGTVVASHVGVLDSTEQLLDLMDQYLGER